MPKIFRMTKAGQFQKGIFAGSTINTPSMMAVEDCIDALKWADNLGGNAGLIARSEANLQVVRDFVDAHDWISFLANEDAITSSTSICLSLDLPADKIKEMTKMLEAEDVAYDIGAYRDAPPGLRIWGGATVESDDMAKLMPWLKWAYDELA